jgi:hypothetical protein
MQNILLADSRIAASEGLNFVLFTCFLQYRLQLAFQQQAAYFQALQKIVGVHIDFEFSVADFVVEIIISPMRHHCP